MFEDRQIFIIGHGKAGSWLFDRLLKTKLISPDQFLSGRKTGLSTKPIKPSVFFLAVPDRFIKSTAKAYRDIIGSELDHWFVHLSGAAPSQSIIDVIGSKAASFHPAISIPNITESQTEIDPTVTLEGDSEVCDWLFRLAKEIGCAPLKINSESKPLYHAACVLAGSLNSLFYSSICRVFESVGFTSEESTKLTKDLMTSSIANIDRFGIEIGMTGPIVRGDDATKANNVEALEHYDKNIANVYKTLCELKSQKI